jgi:HSP20 family protein
MTEVRVTKESKTEHTEMFPWFGLEAPLIRGTFFGVNPFDPMKHFTEELDRTLGYETANAPPDAWRPAIEVKEDEDNLLVTVELPGVKKEDVRVYVRADALVVERKCTYEKEAKREGYFHTERSYGRYYRCGAQE